MKMGLIQEFFQIKDCSYLCTSVFEFLSFDFLMCLEIFANKSEFNIISTVFDS